MNSSLRLVFAGTPDFAVQALQSVLAAGHQVCAVYTQPDRPAGRGRKLSKSPVKILAEQQHIPVFQPVTLRDPAEQQALQGWHQEYQELQYWQKMLTAYEEARESLKWL